jgi:hypothetical protein
LPSEHGELMSQHEQLDVFGDLAAPGVRQGGAAQPRRRDRRRKAASADAPRAHRRALGNMKRTNWSDIFMLPPQRRGRRRAVRLSTHDRRERRSLTMMATLLDDDGDALGDFPRQALRALGFAGLGVFRTEVARPVEGRPILPSG